MLLLSRIDIVEGKRRGGGCLPPALVSYVADTRRTRSRGMLALRGCSVAGSCLMLAVDDSYALSVRADCDINGRRPFRPFLLYRYWS